MRMKKLLLATIALTSLALGSSFAADLRVRGPAKAAPAYVPAAPVYNWSGLYIGGHIGGAFAGSDFFGHDDARFIAGGQIGADYQFAPNWVLGIEANYSFADTNDSGSAFFGNRNLGSVTGRLGYAWGPTLLYAKGGYAWADTRHSFGFTGNQGESGYTVGGGLEYMFAQNWSTKLEYQYYNFGDVTFQPSFPLVATTFKNDEHTIKLGLNYRFNWAGMAGPRGY